MILSSLTCSVHLVVQISYFYFALYPIMVQIQVIIPKPWLDQTYKYSCPTLVSPHYLWIIFNNLDYQLFQVFISIAQYQLTIFSQQISLFINRGFIRYSSLIVEYFQILIYLNQQFCSQIAFSCDYTSAWYFKCMILVICY